MATSTASSKETAGTRAKRRRRAADATGGLYGSENAIPELQHVSFDRRTTLLREARRRMWGRPAYWCYLAGLLVGQVIWFKPALEVWRTYFELQEIAWGWLSCNAVVMLLFTAYENHCGLALARREIQRILAEEAAARRP